MSLRILPVCLLAAVWGVSPLARGADETPAVGYDALLRLDQLPLLADWPAHQDSSYGRKNDNADAGNFLRIEKNGEQVMMDAEGPGIIYRLWSTGVVGTQMSDKCRFRFYFDGEEKPRLDLSVPELFGAKGSKYPFVPPLSVTFESGAAGNPGEGPCNLCYVPIPFAKHLKITGRNVMFYHVDYLKLSKAAALPSWTPEWAKSREWKHKLAALQFERVGDDPKPAVNHIVGRETQGEIAPGAAMSVNAKGPAFIYALRLKLAKSNAKLLRGLLLRITFDDAEGPSVLTPLGDFFGTGAGDRRFRSLMTGMTDKEYYSYWPMPFAKRARVEIVNDTTEAVTIERFNVMASPVKTRAANTGFFHARYVQDRDCPLRKDYTILDVKGHRGKYVGVNITMQNARGAQGIFFLEGDEKIYCDGEKWPSRWLGTGTEDYYNGAYFWNHPNKAAMVRPLGGLTFLDWGIGRVCAYRWHLTDWISFRDSIRVDQEHGPVSDIPTNYSSIAYYYLDAPTAQKPLPPRNDRLLVTSLSPAPRLMGCTLDGKPSLNGKPVKSRTFHEAEATLDGGDDVQHFAASAPGDTIDVKIQVPGEEVVRPFCYLSGGPEYGSVDITLDGHKLGSVDAYRPEFQPWLESSLKNLRLKKGSHTLRLSVTGKNKAASAAHVGFVALQLRPTSPMVGVWNTIGTWPCVGEKGWKTINPPEKEQNLRATYDVPGRGKLTWKTVDKEHVHFGGDQSVAYGLTYVWSPDERSVACFLGRDDSLKVWINDVVVFDVWSFSHLIPDSSFCTVTLKKGWNKVLVKNANWSGGFGYCVRFGDPDRVLKYARSPKE
ncbi:MAG TPA: glycoside hydrolase family 172 protein [Gemmataceae bacterium]|nr:glycoside hydrolase family 172 protein [Gemmataceae bacterium]